MNILLVTGCPVVGCKGQAAQELGRSRPDQREAAGQDTGLLPEPELLPPVHQDSEEARSED